MKKTLKWLFFSPFILFGLWLICLFSTDFRESFINILEANLKAMEREIERTF